MTTRLAVFVALCSLGNLTSHAADPSPADLKAAAAAVERGNKLLGEEKFDQAIKEYDEAIRLAPTFGRAYLGRGIVKGAKAEWKKAVADFDEAVRLEPEAPEGYYNRGFCRLRMDQPDQAI